MNIKGIIFDFGFTLFYFQDATVEKYFECFQKGLKKSVELLKQKQIIKDERIVKKFINLFNEKRQEFWKESIKTKNEFLTSYIFKHILEIMVEKQLIPELELEGDFYDILATEFHSEETKEWKPYENTESTLKELLNRNIKLAVLSNHPHHHSIENLLKTHRLFDLFEIVVTSAQFGRRKPDPDIFMYTLRKMNLRNFNPSDYLICGDEYADIVGGHSAGLKTILCERKVKFPFEKAINVPNVIRVSEISEILNIIT